MNRAVVDSLRAAAYTIPTDAPEADGTADWDSTTVVVVTAYSGDAAGIGWTYAPAACARVVEDMLKPVVCEGDVMSVAGLWARMCRAVRNATRPGIAGYAISAVDVALWDLKARILGLPLADLFGRARESVPVYGSGGFTTYSDARLTEQLSGWTVDQQIPRVKIKIGEGAGTREARDLARIRRARDVVGPDVDLYVDANGAYSAKQAIRLMHAADADVKWFEEPVSSDDLEGLRTVRNHVDADVAAGEYGSDLTYFRRMCETQAVDCLQIDATRCGGYTEWVRAAAIAAAFHLDVSGHCAPHLHAPVATATAGLRHVEWFHDHVRIEQLLFDGTLDPQGGRITLDRARVGHGLELRPDRVAEFQVCST